jgi:Co/Zn/Cd efflux system component
MAHQRACNIPLAAATEQNTRGRASAASGGKLEEEARAKIRAANRVTWAGVAINLVLAGFKLFCGVVGQSAAMIADAGHSLSDLVSDFVTVS